MDRLTRNSIIISVALFILLIVSLAWNNYELRPRVWQLDEVLDEDPVLSNYPYDFRVLVFLNGIVTLSSPNGGGEAPIQPFLIKTDPALADKTAESAEMAAAERHFREIEMRAIQLMLAQPDVDSVLWSLDRAWYHRHRVPLTN
ncbi:hypothetical protein [Thiocystis violacea]|uniref:hypothetical protein n=1 Tax=Thiocystis violacea TaxID=13725 RepID=UPI001907740A|nr:hypothetical protein [Thiocystis violacea]MBK1719583.1 hypothetical protein [Thiocystis violacea]